MKKNQYNPDVISPLFDPIQKAMEEKGVDIFQLSILSGVDMDALCGLKYNGQRLSEKNIKRISVVFE